MLAVNPVSRAYVCSRASLRLSRGFSALPFGKLGTFTSFQLRCKSASVPVMWGFMFTMGAGLLIRFPKLKLVFLGPGQAGLLIPCSS